ncbi:MAG: PIN domain-containing protein [Chloroflexi bacterium]|nr:PIN domain-containing protein [Chloroflexota bacterium]
MSLNPGNHYLFDTTFFSDLIDQQDIGSNPKALDVISVGPSGYSLITLAEIYAKPVNDSELEFREELLSIFHNYPLTMDIARMAGEFRRLFAADHRRNRDVSGLPDCLIAATYKSHDLIWFTRDERHAPKFRRFGISVQTYTLQT